MPKGTRRDETAPHPLQVVPQPSATNSQALLNEFTARASADARVSQGDHAQITINANTTKISGESFLSMMNPFFQVTLNVGE
jgi:hypothetical protein